MSTDLVPVDVHESKGTKIVSAEEEEGKRMEEMAHGKKVPLVVEIAVHYPFVVYGLVIGLALLSSYASLGFFDLSNPLVGLRIRDDVAAERADGWIQALDELRPDFGEGNDIRQPTQTVNLDSLIILYIAEDGKDNVFTLENIAKMAALEDALTQVPGYDNFCLLDPDNNLCSQVLSPVRYLRNATNEAEIEAGLLAMWNDRETDKDATQFHFCLEFDNVTNIKCSKTRSLIRFGFPLAGFLNIDDREKEQRGNLTEFIWEDGFFDILETARDKFQQDGVNEMVVTFFQEDIFNQEVLVILGQDVTYIGISVGVIFMIMLIHTQSPFLAFFGLLQIILSFPMCFAIYRLVFGIELFGGLNIISLFLILGIGVDDIFIYTDAVKQSRALLSGEWSFEKRLGWAFHRASYTMATTTITTGFAFLMLATSIIPVIRYFGIFTSLLIFVNYFMVITAYTCILVFWSRFLDEGGKVGCAPKQKSLSMTERFFRDIYFAKVMKNWKARSTIMGIFTIVIIVATIFAAQIQLAEKSLSFWAEDHYFGLFLNNVPDSFKKSEDELGIYDTVEIVHGMKAPFVDREGTKETLDKDFGAPLFADDFDISDPAAQEFLRDMCYDIVENRRDSLFLSKDLENKEDVGQCWMAAYALWRIARNESFPIPQYSPTLPLAQLVDGIRVPVEALEETIHESVKEFLSRPNFGPDFFISVGFARDGGLDQLHDRIRFSVNSFAMRTTGDDSYDKRSKVKEAWDGYLDELAKSQPESLGEDTFYTDFIYFVWQRTQFLFLNNAILSVVLSLVLAFVCATVATRNWVLGGIATSVILTVVVVIVASIVWMGNKLGSIESVLLVLVLGISIDYVLHLSVGYSDAQFDQGLQTRSERVEHTLTTIGTSVFGGALSTGLATSVLLFTTITFFSKFATIMVLTVVVAFLVAILLFPVILMQVGPEGTAGNVCASSKLARGGGIDVENAKEGKETEDTMAVRSPSVIRKSLFAYVVILIALIGLILASFFIRSDQIKKEEQEEQEASRVIYDDSFFMPAFDDLEIGQWTELRPGGETLCSRETPYAFFVRRGAPGAPLIVEFEGGGACWSESTCQKSTSTFKDTIEGTRAAFERYNRGMDRGSGLKDDNGPYYNFTHIYIPYCSGDLHWGNSTIQYTPTLKITHRGSINAGSVMQYISDHLTGPLNAPPRVLVTGCSAGAYGSFMWATHIANLYENTSTKVVQMGDSGMGVVTEEFMSESFQNWRVEVSDIFPFFIVPPSALPLNVSNLTLPLLYQWAGNRFPNVTFGQMSSGFDWNQAFFLKTMRDGEAGVVKSEDKELWHAEMSSLYDPYLATNPSNVIVWLGPGDYHCSIPFDRHYNVDGGNGVRLYKLLHSLLLNDTFPVETIDCRDIPDKCKQGVDLRPVLSKY